MFGGVKAFHSFSVFCEEVFRDETLLQNASGTLPSPAGAMPALRSATVPVAGSRGFPAPWVQDKIVTENDDLLDFPPFLFA
jgi:hypothetical protein